MRRFRVVALVVALAAIAAGSTGDGDRVLQPSGSVCHEQGGQEFCPADGRCHPDGKCDQCEGHLTEDIDAHECIDRTTFSSHAAVDLVAAVIWFFGAGLAMSAGVGGGGIFVPLGVVLLRFASKPSTGLSQASIFGASLGGLLLNVRARHPLANRPLIDFDMALFLAPMEMAGALLGVIVQRILPTWAVIVLMAVILGFTAYKTFTKGFKTLKKERALKKQRQEVTKVHDVSSATAAEAHTARNDDRTGDVKVATSSTPPPEPPPPETPPPEPPQAPKQAWDTKAGDEGLPSVEEWLARDAANPYESAALLMLMWLMLIVLLVVKGGKGTAGLVEYCSGAYWSVTAVSFLWLFGFAICMGRRAVAKTLKKSAVGYPFVEGDVRWTWRVFRFYCWITFVAGVVAGIIGIGGGMVLGPMMLQLGVLPQVSAATTATMIAMTSSAAALVFVTSGLVPYTYAAFFFCLAFIGAYLGKKYIDGIVKKHQLTAIIILILACIISFASAMMSVNGAIIYSQRDWNFEGFNDVC